MGWGFRHIFVLLLGLTLCLAPGLRAEETLVDSAAGLPLPAQGPLNADTFVPVQTQRLKHAKVLWVNYDLLREMGFEIPPGGMTPEFERQLLDAFAWSIPQKGDPADAFLPEKKTFYADRYGGSGIGNGYGSGRAAAAGRFQIKGVGITPLVDRTSTPHGRNDSFFERIRTRLSDYAHNHGGASISEAIHESLWGELMHREMPYGANRVAVVLSTGTYTNYWGPVRDPRALIVRENSVRPAHYMANWHRMKLKQADEERERIKALLPLLPGSLADTGNPPKKNDPHDIAAKFELMADRMARVLATQFARSYFAGNISNSNFEITGKTVDYGPMTTVGGFPRAIFASDSPAGDAAELDEGVLTYFPSEIRRYAPEEWRDKIPKVARLREVAQKAYEDQLDREFLWLAGAPPETIDGLLGTKTGKEFTAELQRLARLGNEESRDVRYNALGNRGHYDLHVALVALDRLYSGTDVPGEIERLMRAVPDNQTRGSLAALYRKFRNRLEIEGEKQKIPPDRLARYQTLAIERRNRPHPELSRRWDRVLMERVLGWRGSEAVSQFMETHLAATTKADHCGGWCVEIEEKRRPESGTRLRRFYDAKRGREQLSLELTVSGKSASVLGRPFPVSKAETLTLVLIDGTSLQPEKVVREDGSVRLVFDGVPLSSVSGVRAGGGVLPLTGAGSDCGGDWRAVAGRR